MALALVPPPPQLELWTWRLECLDGAVPCELCPDASEGVAGEWADLLRVGRTVHTECLWQRLLPDAAVRQTISREHFDITCAAGGPASPAGACELRNLSSRGTWLNGSLVTGSAQLRTGDVLGVGRVVSEYGLRPAVHFRFVAARAPSPAATLAGDAAGAREAESGLSEWLPLPPPPPAVPLANVPEEDGEDFAPSRAGPAEVPLPDASETEEFSLICTSVAADVDKPVTVVTLPIRFQGGTGVLRVGRALQEPEFWETLVPDSKLRSNISREHFEVYVDAAGAAEDGGEGVLINLSESGTLVGGQLVTESCRLSRGDVVGLPLGRRRSAASQGAIVEFRLHRRAGAASAAPSDCSQEAVPSSGPEYFFIGDSADGAKASGSVADQGHAGAQAPESAPTPLPFSLKCMQTRGLLLRDLERLPGAARLLEPACSSAPSALLRVGRAIQPPDFWKALLPSEELRNTVSREHFEIIAGERGLRLRNLSGFGTLVNSELVRDEVDVSDGDTVAVRATNWRDSIPTVEFRLGVGAERGASCHAVGLQQLPRPGEAQRPELQECWASGSAMFELSVDSSRCRSIGAGPRHIDDSPCLHQPVPTKEHSLAGVSLFAGSSASCGSHCGQLAAATRGAGA